MQLHEVKQFSRSLDSTFPSETIGEYPDHEDGSIAAMTTADQLDNDTDTPFARHGDIWLIRDDGQYLVRRPDIKVMLVCRPSTP